MRIKEKEFYLKKIFWIKVILIFVVILLICSYTSLTPLVIAIVAIVAYANHEFSFLNDSDILYMISNLKKDLLKVKTLSELYRDELKEGYDIRERWNSHVRNVLLKDNDKKSYKYGHKNGELWVYTFLSGPDERLLRYYEAYLENTKDKKIISHVKNIIKELEELSKKGINDFTLSDAVKIKSYADDTLIFSHDNPYRLYEGCKIRLDSKTLSKQIIYLAKKEYDIDLEKEKEIEYFRQADLVKMVNS